MLRHLGQVCCHSIRRSCSWRADLSASEAVAVRFAPFTVSAINPLSMVTIMTLLWSTVRYCGCSCAVYRRWQKSRLLCWRTMRDPCCMHWLFVDQDIRRTRSVFSSVVVYDARLVFVERPHFVAHKRDQCASHSRFASGYVCVVPMQVEAAIFLPLRRAVFRIVYSFVAIQVRLSFVEGGVSI